MKMYKCTECGHLMEEGEIASWKEPHEEILHGCPKCFGAVKEAKPCIVCGTYEYDADENCCSECKKTVQEKFNKMLEKSFTKQEQEVIKNCLEFIGEWV